MILRHFLDTDPVHLIHSDEGRFPKGLQELNDHVTSSGSLRLQHHHHSLKGRAQLQVEHAAQLKHNKHRFKGERAIPHVNTRWHCCPYFLPEDLSQQEKC